MVGRVEPTLRVYELLRDHTAGLDRGVPERAEVRLGQPADDLVQVPEPGDVTVQCSAGTRHRGPRAGPGAGWTAVGTRSVGVRSTLNPVLPPRPPHVTFSVTEMDMPFLDFLVL